MDKPHYCGFFLIVQLRFHLIDTRNPSMLFFNNTHFMGHHLRSVLHEVTRT